MALTNLLINHPEEEVRSVLIEHAISRATKAIQKEDDQVSARAAIQVLEHFMTKGVVDALDIIQPKIPQGTHRHSTDRTARYCKGPAIGVENLALSILQWVQYPDCAPVAGRLLATFFQSLQNLSSVDENQDVLNKASPLWIVPVKLSLEWHPEHLEIYENHVLPGLLRLSLSDREAFLGTLPLLDIQRGKVGRLPVSDVQLSLLVAKIDTNTFEDQIHDTSAERHSDGQKAKDPMRTNILTRDNEHVSSDGVQLGINLLEHSYPAVRIAALSFLISSPASKHYFNKEVLDSFRRCLPCFQIEVNVKARNEFIALAKKLCKRLKVTISSLAKDVQIWSSIPGHSRIPQSARSNEQGEPNTANTLQEHISFRSWYVRFLVRELRPTSSYQSHITALKVLPVLLERDIKDQFSEGCHSLLRSLLDLLLDPFSDVREAANFLLQSRPLFNEPSFVTEASDEDFNTKIMDALLKAEFKAAETGRADHADGIGRLYNVLYDRSKSVAVKMAWYDNAALIVEHLISKLENEIDIAKRNLLLTVGVVPLHGHLIALK